MIPTERVRAFLEREQKRDPRPHESRGRALSGHEADRLRPTTRLRTRKERPQAAQCAGRGREQVGDSARSRPARARRLLRPASAALAAQGDPLSAAAGDRDPRMHGLGLVVLCEIAQIDPKSDLSGIQRKVRSSQRRNLAPHVVEDRKPRPHKALLGTLVGIRSGPASSHWRVAPARCRAGAPSEPCERVSPHTAQASAVKIRCRSRRTSASTRRQSIWRQRRASSSGPLTMAAVAVAASSLSFGSGASVIFFLTCSPDRVSTLSSPGTRPDIRPVMRDRQLEGLAAWSRFPVAFPLPAFASRSSDSRQGIGLSLRSAYRARPSTRTPTGLPRSARTSCDRGGCPL